MPPLFFGQRSSTRELRVETDGRRNSRCNCALNALRVSAELEAGRRLTRSSQDCGIGQRCVAACQTRNGPDRLMRAVMTRARR